jgi:hypothetical protein
MESRVKVTQFQLDSSIYELENYGLSLLIIQLLEREFKINTIEDLTIIPIEELAACKGMGKNRLQKLRLSLLAFLRNNQCPKTKNQS